MSAKSKMLCKAAVAFASACLCAAAMASVSFSDDSGPVTPVDGTVTLGAGGKIRYSGNETLVPVVNATADLMIESDEVCERVYAGAIFPKTRETAITLFQNMNLTEWEPTYTDFDHNDDPQITNIKGDGYARYVRRYTDGSGNAYLTAQMQNAATGAMVLIYLLQSGNNVVGYAKSARYSGKATRPSTYPDYENPDEWGNSWTVATASVQGYNVNHLVMRRIAKPKKLTVTNEVSVASTLAIASSAHVVAQGEEAFVSGAAAFGGTVAVTGTLEIAGRAITTLGGTYSGLMGVVKVDPHKDMAERQPETVSNTDIDLTATGGFLPRSDWALLKENARVADVVEINVTNMFFSTSKFPTKSFFFKNDGLNASVVAQEVKAGNVRAGRVQLRQNGGNVEIRADKTWYNAPTGYDFENNPEGIANEYAGYSVADWVVTFATPTNARVEVAADMGGMLFGTVDVVNAEGKGLHAYITNREYPTLYGKTQFGPCADVTFDNSWDHNTTVARDFTLRVYSNSVLKATKDNQFNKRRGSCVLADSSEIRVGGGWGYRNIITFRNGSRMLGLDKKNPTCNLGFTSDANWGVDGVGASSYDGNTITLVGGQNADYAPWTLKVLDTTGDDAADFIINADINANSGYTYHNTYKTGAGTVQINGTYSANFHPLHLEGGAWKAGITDSFSASALVDIDFSGGNLEFASETTNVLGVVSLAKDATITLGVDAEASFGDTSAVEWGEGKKLTVSMGDGARLRFGADANALTAAQLASITVNGRKAVIDDEGYVTEKPKLGITIIVH